MSTLIKSSVKYTDYDTTASVLVDTLVATVGKEYEVRNSGTGGNTLTITYGSDTQIFNDGESGRFTYDGIGWATQFSALVGNVYTNSRDWTAETAGFIPVDGVIWYYNSHPSYSGIIHVIGDGVSLFSVLDIYAAPFQGGPIQDWTTETVGYIPVAGLVKYYDTHPDYSGIIHVIGDGVTAFSSLDVYYQEWQYESPTLDFSSMAGSTFPIPVDANKIDANTVRCTFTWGNKPLSTAASIAFEDITKYTIYGGGANQPLDGTYAFNFVAVNDRFVMATITKTAGFGSLTGDTGLEIRHAGNGGIITLS